jgi:CRISPR/Cas system CMR-associated protein Cmr5 small subunit
MKNLEQVRAGNALKYCQSEVDMTGKKGGNVLKKVPSLIMGNGLMAAAAFAYAQKDTGWRNCFDSIARHLACPEIGVLSGCKDLAGMLQKLADADSQVLKLATDEAMAWLAFARRFEASRGDDAHDTDE